MQELTSSEKLVSLQERSDNHTQNAKCKEMKVNLTFIGSCLELQLIIYLPSTCTYSRPCGASSNVYFACSSGCYYYSTYCRVIETQTRQHDTISVIS